MSDRYQIYYQGPWHVRMVLLVTIVSPVIHTLNRVKRTTYSKGSQRQGQSACPARTACRHSIMSCPDFFTKGSPGRAVVHMVKISQESIRTYSYVPSSVFVYKK